MILPRRKPRAGKKKCSDSNITIYHAWLFFAFLVLLASTTSLSLPPFPNRHALQVYFSLTHIFQLAIFSPLNYVGRRKPI